MPKQPKDSESVRVQVRVSKDMKEYYDKYADEMGTSTSACMAFVLKSYMDGLQATKTTSTLEQLLKQIQKNQ